MAMGVINQSTCSSGDIDLAIDVRFGSLRCGRCAPSDQFVSYANGISALVFKMLVLPYRD
jgi:hypothetical protein